MDGPNREEGKEEAQTKKWRAAQGGPEASAAAAKSVGTMPQHDTGAIAVIVSFHV
jgi:hypothetical protein